MPQQYEKVPEDSPDRCMSMRAGDQCPFKKLEGSDYCGMHARGFLKRKEKQGIKNLILTKWKAEIQTQASSSNIFSLRDEIGVSRLMMQSILNKCETAEELMQHSQPISQLLGQTERLVSSCFKLESTLGEFLTQEQLANIAEQIIKVIGSFVTDADTLAAISEQIINVCQDYETE